MLDECKELKIKILEQSTVPWDIKGKHNILEQQFLRIYIRN